MYYIVHLSTLKKDRLRKLVDDWRKTVKYRLPKEIRGEIVMEKWVNEYRYIMVVNGTLAGLWIARKLKKLCEKHGIPHALASYETKYIDIDDERYLDQKIREKIEEIPPHLVHEIRESLLKIKLPRGKKRHEIIEAMKQ